MKQILFIIAIFGIVCFNLIPLSAQFYFPGDSEFRIGELTDELFTDATTEDLGWVLENQSILSEEDRVEAIEDYHTVHTNPFMNDGFCWKGSYGRGAGKIPSDCDDGWQYQAGLCYRKCAPGYYGVSFVCWGETPPGFTNNGVFVLKPSAYGRGGGYAAWQMGKCERENGQGNCEWYGAMIYPKCAQGYHNFGCCLCSPDCPPGYTDIGISCSRPNYTRGVGKIPKGCHQGKENSGGLCYNKCRDGYKGVGPVCWGNTCPSNWTDCGLGCSETTSGCVSNIADMVLSPLEAIASIAGMVVTAGASGAITVTAKAGKVVKTFSKVVDLSSKVVSISQAAILDDLFVEFSKQNRRAPNNEEKKGLEEYASMAMDAMKTHDISWKDFTSLDPTGLSSVAAAYAHPSCATIAAGGNRSTSSTTTTTPSSGPWAPLSNVAYKKTARQSSTIHGGLASKLTDGNRNGNWSGNSIAHTDMDNGAWVQIDLGKSHQVTEVKIYNRTDCCSERNRDLIVAISDSPYNWQQAPYRYQVYNAGTTAPANIFSGKHGRYVTLYLPRRDYLNLAEVEVMGRPSY